MQCLIFSIDQQYFGFDLSYIVRVISAVEITPLPNALKYMLGMINIHGDVIPVISLRKLLGIADREIELSDQFLISHVEGRLIALWVDLVSGIMEYTAEALIPAKEVFPDIKGVDYVVKGEDRIILMYDLKKLLPEACYHGTNIAT